MPAASLDRALSAHNLTNAVTTLECLLSVCRIFVLAITLHFAAGLTAAFAQTVILRNAPQGSTVEFVLNGAVAATATVGADGLATLAASQSGRSDSQSVDAFIWVDECGSTRRVIAMSRTAAPPAADAGCRRDQIGGLFLLQPVTTIVLDVQRSPPTLRLRQGEAPAAWLQDPSADASGTGLTIAPRGVILFGGGGRMLFSEFSAQACGDVTSCTAEDQAFSGTGGIGYWFSEYGGAEASYLRPGRITADGSGTRFSFDSEMDGELLLFVGKGGVPIGRVRLFGMGGVNYHRATFTTRQTTDGSAQTLQWRTEGWGPAFGGGAEVWVTPSIGLYGEFGRLGLKGDDAGGGEAQTDAWMSSIIGGVRVRIFGR
jgi:hypothetical protein